MSDNNNETRVVAARDELLERLGGFMGELIPDIKQKHGISEKYTELLFTRAAFEAMVYVAVTICLAYVSPAGKAGAILRMLGSIECVRGLNRLNAIVTLAVENILTTVGLFNPIGEAVTEDEAADLEAQA